MATWLCFLTWTMAADAAGSAPRSHFLEVELNGTRTGRVELFLVEQGEVLAPAALLESLRFTYSGAPAAEHEGTFYYRLSGFSGLSWQIDDAAQLLILNARPELFRTTRLSARDDAVAGPMSGSRGLYLNYDLLAGHTAGDTEGAGLLELAGYGGSLFATSTGRLSTHGSGPAMVRLDTSMTHDDTGNWVRWRLGDSISRGSSWGRPVRFGGLQIGRAFDVVPGFVTTPTLDAMGAAELPSTVDLYVDGVFQRRAEVPAGPFVVEDVPQVGPGGDVQLVIRDLLGREQVITAQYTTTQGLLRPGLTDFAVQAGALREEYGRRSMSYGDLFAAGTARGGITEWLTAEAHGEAGPDHVTAGLGAVTGSALGTVTAALAASRSDDGDGVLGSLGIDRAGRVLSFGGLVEWSSRRFRQIGDDPDHSYRRRIQARAGLIPTDGLSLGLSATHLGGRVDGGDITLLGATASVRTGARGFLSVSANYEPAQGDAVFGLSFVMPLGGGITAGASITSQAGRQRATVQAQRSADPVEGTGWRLLHTQGDGGRTVAGLSANSMWATVSGEAARFGGETDVRLQAAGSIVWAEGNLFAARTIQDGFAVVDAGGLEGLDIRANGRKVARTDARGLALVTGLRAYEHTNVQLDPTDLPFESTVAESDRAAVPYYRSGLRLDFAITVERGVRLRLVRSNGEPVPLGARANLSGGPPQPVGHGGEVFLPDLTGEAELTVHWTGGGCTVLVPAPPLDEALPLIGPLVCREAA